MRKLRDRTTITSEELQRKFIYDPDTGKIYRKIGTSTWSERGNEAFCRLYGGYLEGNYCNLSFSAHRVAWALHYGEWPDGQIDHINGDGRDNRLSNLRVVSNLENCRNLGRRPTRTGPDSGVNGVYWHKQSKKWMARLKVNGKWIYLGTHSDLTKAVDVRRRAETAYGFHENHSRRPARATKSSRILSLLD